MERRFDATLKSMLEDAPSDWPRLLGIGGSGVRVIDADISTISGAADKVLWLPGPPPWILHLEFQSGPDASLPCDLNAYNSVLEKRHGLPVRSVLILLSPRAQLAALSGEYRRQVPGASAPYRLFQYDVVRVWELPVEPLLAGGLGTLPLAPISAVSATELPSVLLQMTQRLAQHRDRGRVGRLWTAVYVLMGLRYEQALVRQLLQGVMGVMGMKDSVTYQAIVAEGRAEGAIQELRKVLLALGQDRFGMPAPARVLAALESASLEQLEMLARQVLHADSWQQLLAEFRKPARRKKGSS